MIVDSSSGTRPVAAGGQVRWRQVGVFLLLAYGLTWLIDFVLWRTAGYASPASIVVLQLQMLIPAFSAILLGLFFFRDSSIRYGRLTARPRAFFLYYLVFTLAFAAMALGSLVSPGSLAIFSPLSLGLSLLGLLFFLALRVTGGGEAMARAGLAGGKPRYWLLYGVAFVLFYFAQTLLNYLFGLGHAADFTAIARQVGMPETTLLVLAFVQSVVVGPFVGLLFGFGEEYGWRGYLQGELVKLGRVRGILLVGIIWGLWHAPIIAMGHNYPGYPVLGIFLMIAYSTGLAFVLGYAVLKTGSVWLAAFLHALNNQVYSFTVAVAYSPADPVFSFGAGIYGIAILALVVLLILRDPVWKEA